MDVFEFTNVTKQYDGKTALAGLSFCVGSGESVCLFGPSGCGKTTTLRLIAGFEQSDRGTVDSGIVRKPGAIGMVFQDLALWPHMQAEHHIDFVLKGIERSRATRRERMRQILELCRIWDKRHAYPAEMSGGEQQRLAIARALATNPVLLLLDEPFANLDAALREHFLAEFRRRKQGGTAIVFATHDPFEAEYLADRIIPMKDGIHTNGV